MSEMSVSEAQAEVLAVLQKYADSQDFDRRYYEAHDKYAEAGACGRLRDEALRARAKTSALFAAQAGEVEALRGALEAIVNYSTTKHAEFDAEFDRLRNEREGCEECAHAQRINWPPSGLCNTHYTPWSRLIDRRQSAVEHDDKWGRVAIARAALGPGGGA